MTRPPASPADLGAFSHLAPELAQTFASVAGDIALVVDVSGVVRNVAVGGGQPLPSSVQQWIGQRWSETASEDTRAKIDALLQEAVDSGVSRRREVNLRLDGVDVPLACAAVRLGEYGPVLAVGRDLRAVTAIQQRFVDTQQQMEREYWKKRQAESRYRMLFQVATDAVLVVDPQSLAITEVNRAAAKLFDQPLEGLLGQSAAAAFDRTTRPHVEALLALARETGRPAEARARLAVQASPVYVSAAPFRSDGAPHLLVRVRAADPPSVEATDTPAAELVARIPDGVVIADAAGRVLMANQAFGEMCRLPADAPLAGLPLGRWIDESEAELTAILARVRGHGIEPQLAVALRCADGTVLDVELSAALLDEGDQQRIGLTVRRLGERARRPPLLRDLTQAVQHLALQIGHEPLPALLRQATDLAERHLIAAAIDRAGGNLAEAAAVLDISPHSLELRLRRLGLASTRTAEPD